LFRGILPRVGKREGWICSGNDLSPLRREFGRRNLGVDFALAPFSALPSEPLEVVVMRHVLEHLRDPLVEISSARDRLVDGGLLVVEAPNYAAPSLRLKTWRQRIGLRRGSLRFLGVPEHQWQFTARTLGLLLKKAGLRVVSVGTASRQANHSAPVRALLRQTLHRLRLGSYLVMVARKQEATSGEPRKQ
jgi:SAM-dependent methyltransferase